ncbi:MAG: ribbon-helix-helix domain-containing protein, partial [Halobacteria archaeon]|nr:ribbon-helix-helix domain-containing protein [Halobacteria archaeon]
MGRINVRVDEELLDEVDSHGDVRSEVVRNALKQYLGVEAQSDELVNVKQSEQHQQQLAQVVEDVVNEKIEDDIYPRLGNIYDKLDEEMDDESEKVPLEVQVNLDAEVYNFYDNYTRAFETTVS